jgi:hypothetical protein
MTLNRNHYFLIGLVVLFLGIEFRLVDSMTLSPECTAYLAKKTRHPAAAVNTVAKAVTPDHRPILKKSIKPPDWIGWCLLSVGSVLVLHSWAMPKPGG